MSTTLIQELEQAAKRAGERCFERHGAQRMCLNSQFDGCEHTKEERVLRERAERARLAPKLLSGEVQIPGVVTPQEFLAWLTGPLPDTSPETPGKLTECPTCGREINQDAARGAAPPEPLKAP